MQGAPSPPGPLQAAATSARGRAGEVAELGGRPPLTTRFICNFFAAKGPIARSAAIP